MLYTILGGFLGGIVSYSLLKCFNVSFRSGDYGMSYGDLGVLCGIMMGIACGFGFGTSQLFAGTHPINKLIPK